VIRPKHRPGPGRPPTTSSTRALPSRPFARDASKLCEQPRVSTASRLLHRPFTALTSHAARFDRHQPTPTNASPTHNTITPSCARR
jgi:hypothetical protein